MIGVTNGMGKREGERGGERQSEGGMVTVEKWQKKKSRLVQSGPFSQILSYFTVCQVLLKNEFWRFNFRGLAFSHALHLL